MILTDDQAKAYRDRLAHIGAFREMAARASQAAQAQIAQAQQWSTVADLLDSELKAWQAQLEKDLGLDANATHSLKETLEVVTKEA